MIGEGGDLTTSWVRLGAWQRFPSHVRRSGDEGNRYPLRPSVGKRRRHRCFRRGWLSAHCGQGLASPIYPRVKCSGRCALVSGVSAHSPNPSTSVQSRTRRFRGGSDLVQSRPPLSTMRAGSTSWGSLVRAQYRPPPKGQLNVLRRFGDWYYADGPDRGRALARERLVFDKGMTRS